MANDVAPALQCLPNEQDKPFVGRRSDLALLAQHFERSRAGKGSVVFASGDDGSGKTTLLQAFSSTLSGATVASTACQLGVTWSTDATAQLLFDLPHGRERHLDIARYKTIENIFDVLATRLTSLARRAPVAILIDDLQVASQRDVALVHWLVNFVAHHGIFVVATISKRSAESGSITLPLHGWLTKGCVLHEIAPLAEADVQLLLRSVAVSRGFTLEPAAMRNISFVAQGIPRLVYELVSEVAIGEDARKTPPIPASARAVAGSLKASLSPATFDVLAIAAVAGERFDGQWLPKLAQATKRGVNQALQAGCDEGLICELADKPGVFYFRRVGERLAMAATLISSRRLDVHEQLASLLLHSHYGRLNEYLVAEHLAASGRIEEAQEWYDTAAGHCRDAGDDAKAAALYERAAECMTRGSDGWAAMACESARWYSRVGLRERAASLREDAVPVLLRTSATIDGPKELYALFMDYVFCERFEDAQRALQQLRELAFAETFRVRAEIMWAGFQAEVGNFEQARAALDSIEVNGVSDEKAKTELLIVRAIVESRTRPLEDVLALIDAADAASYKLGVHEGRLIAQAVGASLASTIGSQAAALERLRIAEDILPKVPDRRELHVQLAFARLEYYVLSGELDEAHELVRAILQKPHGRRLEIVAAAIGLFVGARVGDSEMVRALFDPSLLQTMKASRDAYACGLLVRGFCDLLVTRNDRARAEAIVEAFVGAKLVDSHFCVQIGAGRYGKEATRRLAREQIVGRLGGSDNTVVEASLAMFDAYAHAQDGRPILSVRSARRAAELYAVLDWPLFEAQAQELAGEIPAALDLFAKCGAHSDVARLRRAYTHRNRRSRSTVLTQREREIATLLARGCTDKEIASMLSLSKRTIHHHVSTILSKLGLRSRWQIVEASVTYGSSSPRSAPP